MYKQININDAGFSIMDTVEVECEDYGEDLDFLERCYYMIDKATKRKDKSARAYYFEEGPIEVKEVMDELIKDGYNVEHIIEEGYLLITNF